MKKILVPCDFTDYALNALNYAVATASAISADIVLLHVTAYPVVAPEIGLSAYTYQDAEKDSLAALNKLKEKVLFDTMFKGIIECHTEMGEFTDQVDKIAKDTGATLVIMGISGHGSKFMQSVIGSSAIQVGKKIEVPVLIIPPEYIFKKPSLIIYSCLSDENLKNDNGFVKVNIIARLFDSKVHLLHVINDKDGRDITMTGSYAEHGDVSADHKSYIVHEKNAAEGILHFLSDHAVDIVAVEPKKRPLLERIFHHSVTKEVVFNSNLPVLLVH